LPQEAPQGEVTLSGEAPRGEALLSKEAPGGEASFSPSTSAVQTVSTDFQDFLVSETLTTVFTLKWFVSSMLSHVGCQVILKKCTE